MYPPMRPASRRTRETAVSSESTSMLAWPVRITIVAATLERGNNTASPGAATARSRARMSAGAASGRAAGTARAAPTRSATAWPLGYSLDSRRAASRHAARVASRTAKSVRGRIGVSRGVGSHERRVRGTGMHTTILLAVALVCAAARVAAQITVAKPLDPIPPRRLEYHAPQLLSCPPTQYPDSLQRRAIGGPGVARAGPGIPRRLPRHPLAVRETPPPRLRHAAITTARGRRLPPPP